MKLCKVRNFFAVNDYKIPHKKIELSAEIFLVIRTWEEAWEWARESGVEVLPGY